MWIYKSNLSYEGFISCGSEYGKKYLAELDAEYIRLSNEEVPKLAAEDFDEYKQTGNRLGYERKYFLRRTMLRDFALKAWLGDGDAIKPLEKIITAIYEEPTWSLPAHIGDSEPSEVIDLFAAETAQSLTEIVSLIGCKLPKAVAEQAIAKVKKRVLMPFVNRTQPYNWESMRSNWCAVCGGSVGMTAIYLIEDTDKVKHILKSLEGTFESYMQSFTGDGACLEGLYYWGYGMTYLTAFLDLYRQRTGEEFPVNIAKLTKMADFAHKCCITDSITVSFSDGNERDRIYSGLSSKLTELYGAKPISGEYRAYLSGDDCGRWCRAARDIAWTIKAEAAQTENISVLPDAQWAVVRGGKYSFAVKGGSNGEPHNHNDVGSFTVVKDGKVILCDLGAGEYTRKYFSGDRYNIFCCSSLGHSVPIINGQPQKNDKEYAAGNFAAGQRSAEIDISGAYGIDALKRCIRKIEYTDGKIVLTDTYKLTKPTQITERFITRDSECIACLKTDKQYRTETSTHKHREHDGTVTEVTVIDFIFEADSEDVFTLTIK